MAALLPSALDAFIQALLAADTAGLDLEAFIHNQDDDTLFLRGEESDLFIIKPKGTLTSTNQLIQMLLPSSSIPLNLQLLTLNLKSYFDIDSASSTDSSINSFDSIRSKFDDLSLSLKYLNQKLNIPNLSIPDDLNIEPLDEPDLIKLNKLSSVVNSWTREISLIIKLSNTFQLSTFDEIEFWKSYELGLISLNYQISTPKIKNIINLLLKAKRFHITLSFQNSGLSENLALAKLYNSLLKDLPINNLNLLSFSNTFFNDAELAISSIFSHFSKLRNSSFPLDRALKLIDLVISDITKKLINTLPNLVSNSFLSFLILYNQITKLFVVIDQNIKFTINLIRELLRKRQEKLIIKIDQSDYNKLVSKLNHLKDFLSNHFQLLSLIDNFDQSSSFDQSRKLSDAYNKFILPINPLDISVAGSTVWSINEANYLEISKKSVQFVISKLNHSFSKCDLFSDFLYVYQKYNLLENDDNILLFVTDEYKLKILAAADYEVDRLIMSNSDTSSIFRAINIYSLNNYDEKVSIVEILKRNQILIAKAEFYLQVLLKLMGENWNKYTIGARIDSKISNFINALNDSKVFQDWLRKINDNVSQFEKYGYAVKIVNTNSENELDLVLNFDSTLVQRCHQIQQLLSLGYKIPTSVTINYGKVSKITPFIVGLEQHLAILKQITKYKLITNGAKYGFLLESQKEKILEHVKSLLSVEWLYLLQAIELSTSIDESATGDSLLEVVSLKSLNRFQEEVYKLHTQTSRLEKFNSVLVVYFSELKTCKYDNIEIGLILKKLEEEVLNLSASIPDLSGLLQVEINKEVQDVLTEKCRLELLNFESVLTQNQSIEYTDGKFGSSLDSFAQIVHSIVFEDQAFSLNSPLCETKKKMLQSLTRILKITESKHILKVEAVEENVQNSTYAQHSSLITSILTKIDTLIEDATVYLNEWSILQNIWELDLELPDDLDKLELKFESDLSTWWSVLKNILKFRNIFDVSAPFKLFANGYLKIEFHQVQSRVNLKFDKFQNGLLDKFGKRLHNEVFDFLGILKDAQIELSRKLEVEGQTSSLISNLSAHVNCQDLIGDWNDRLTMCKQSQLLLQKYRYRFGTDWIYVENLENVIATLKTMLSKKSKTIEDNQDLISSKVKIEGKRVVESLESLTKDWNSKKQLSGDLKPASAITILSNYQKLFSNLSFSIDQVKRVSRLLNVPFSVNEDYLEILKEIDEQKTSWSSISILWEELQSLNLIKWKDVQPRELRKQLEELLSSSRGLPGNVRQYSAFDEVQTIIRSHLKNFTFVTNLKGSSMKSRHWGVLLRQLGQPAVDFDDLTMGDVWNLNFNLHEVTVNEMLLQANNEQTIEENLEAISTNWSSITFELFNYNDKCRLIKNWDALFEQCEVDISTLSSMKSSPYFGNFEQEVFEAEARLNKLYVLLDVWIELQQQWVYLDSIFGSDNTEIQNLLPLEFTRFSNISYEFLDSLKRIYKFNLVIDIISISDIQENANKMLDSVVKVRKSLAEYLEKQRELFPRFYFIGNEDLLEIIGSSIDIDKINKHFTKMFTGVASVSFDRDSSSIFAITNENGEIFDLLSPVSLIKFPRLNEWLSKLEIEIKLTLSDLTRIGIERCGELMRGSTRAELYKLIEGLPGQICSLSLQITFTTFCEASLQESNLISLLEKISSFIRVLSEEIEKGLSEVDRIKIENMIIESLHQRDIISTLLAASTDLERQFLWNIQQRFYFDLTNMNPLESVIVKQANAKFNYGFEFLGVSEQMAYTPLVDKCYLAMTLALDQNLGGSPFGPAGTGKTESIKALGSNLGRMVVVFCCDEYFDYQSMERIFLGLCKVGAWGCFDEFNRLDENILSAISSQIEAIEFGLKNVEANIEISNTLTKVNPETGIFVTMNPGYTGRSELPENLKKLFRNFAMTSPETEKIAEVLLSSQGFLYSKELAGIIVPLFLQLKSLSTEQSHYDFGLRALKSTLVACGNFRRSSRLEKSDIKTWEHQILLQCINETIAPKLIHEDEVLLEKLQGEFFSGISYEISNDVSFTTELEKYAKNNGLIIFDDWLKKARQLLQIQRSHHGIILVGNSGSGKSTIWKLVLNCLSKIDGVDCSSYVLDCKVLTKEKVYGSLNLITREWKDGLFTALLRKIVTNLRGELSKRIWIVFDGEIDPTWAENLNSVLDDNKVLTLPNGERLELPSNVRIVFEVDSLKHATPATVTRCGMIWCDSSLNTIHASYHSMLYALENQSIFSSEDLLSQTNEGQLIQTKLILSLKQTINSENLLSIFDEACKYVHVMNFTLVRAMSTITTLLKTYFRRFVQYSVKSKSITLSDVSKFTSKAVILSIIWGFGGDMSLIDREKFSTYIAKVADSEVDVSLNYIDFDISLPEAEWISWNKSVEGIELEPNQVNSNTVIPTLDTTRLESLIYSVMNEHKPLLLCGPPGSGKTMILLEALRKSSRLDVLSLNFSKETTPDSLMRSLKQYCELKKTSSGVTLAPKVSGKWVVVFCDEINLPKLDRYGTQSVIALLRQMIEQNGFWDANNYNWVKISNIQFVGACNPPTDPGRNALTDRFLRHAILVLVDYPGETSLQQIYSSFNLAVMKYVPDLRGFTKAITDAMIQVYSKTRKVLTTDLQSHYIYSPRELTRWSRGLLEALKISDYMDLPSLIRLWYHEGLRLFYDRLVGEWEKNWTKVLFKETIEEFFPSTDTSKILKEPVLISDWLSLSYQSVDKDELSEFISDRLRTFSEEEIEVNLILHENLLDHALRIDRVLKQPQGHMILVGTCTSGKSTLSKFVAWINGLKVVQLKVNKNYGLQEFDSCLRSLLLRCAKGEKLCFIIDESSIMETSFIERMNTLLANSEIPGLFEDENFTDLMNLCLERTQAQGLLLDSHAELYNWFSSQISKNLHVIFNINDTEEINRPKVISSPALFNRCVLSWMGDWSNHSMIDISTKLVEHIPVDISTYSIPSSFEKFAIESIGSFREMLVDIIVFIHRLNISYQPTFTFQKVPKHFMTFISQFTRIFNLKLFELEEDQRHVNNGLDKLRETVIQVNELKAELSQKEEILNLKDQEAKIMLNKMLTEQNEAERKQEFSIATQEELEKQEREISKRKRIVMKDLEFAEPAVLEAQRGVQNIKKQHLTEMRSMSNPPNAVKVTMESVCILLGYEVTSWRDVQLIVRRDDFIPNIVRFDPEIQLTDELRSYMESKYLERPDYNYETVYRASKACGPLVQWVIAQLTYSKILQEIGPLKLEVQVLEAQTKKTQSHLIAIDQMISELEESIEKYKDDYSELIRDAEGIKHDMKTVNLKVKRSSKLIDNLLTERGRWKEKVETFGSLRACLVGNSLLIASMIVYGGVYDQKGRSILNNAVRMKLQSANIEFDKAISLSNYLSRGSEILEWENCGLISDELNVENFIIMNNAETPFIIDPSNKILDVMVNLFKPKKVVVTSFLHDGFVKHVENALRFGGVIVIQDAEHYDPLLDSVLRCEIQKNGGRSIIYLGDLPVDYSPNFKLFLHSRDPKINLSPHVASRTSIVNFSVTSGSLETKVLDLTLQELQPDIEKERRETILLRGEYHVQLNMLETSLLDSLSNSQGNILDDDMIIETLETLKAEATDIDMKLSNTSEVILKVDEIRNAFAALASHSSSLFTTVQNLNKLSKFYSISQGEFVSIFVSVLKQKKGSSSIILDLYREVFACISPSLSYDHKIVLAISLIIDYNFLEIGSTFKNALLLMLSSIVNGEKAIEEILLACGLKLEDDFSNTTENVRQLVSSNKDNLTIEKLSEMILSICDADTKLDIMMNTYQQLTKHLSSGVGYYSSKYDTEYWIQDNDSNITLITSPEGVDPTLKIEGVAQGKKLIVVSMGSDEGIENATKQLELANNSDNWVLLQNIQMSPIWIKKLIKILDETEFNPNFKLFITCNTTSNIPSGLISKAKVLMFENELGLKAIMYETLRYIEKDRFQKASSDVRYVYLLLTWYHSIIVERMRYSPISFTKKYDLNDSDFAVGLNVIDTIFENVKKGTEPINWKSLAYLLGEITYGSKIDQYNDLSYLVELANYLFSEESFHSEFNMIKDTLNEILIGPDENTLETYKSWIDTLPIDTPLSWIHLPDDADLLIKQRQGVIIAQDVCELYE